MVFAPVAFLELLEMNEGMVPGVEEEVLLAALPVAGAVFDGSLGEHIGDGFQELERDQIEARLPICTLGAADKLLNGVAGHNPGLLGRLVLREVCGSNSSRGVYSLEFVRTGPFDCFHAS